MVFDDETLIAYLDGHLSDEDSLRLEAEVARDPVTARRLEHLATSADLARRAFEPVMQDPVPPQLIAAVWNAPRPQVSPVAAEGRTTSSPATMSARFARLLWPAGAGWRGWSAGFAVAALMAVLVAPPVLRGPSDLEADWALQQGQQLRGDPIAVAVELAPSGRLIELRQSSLSVVSTFETREGFCREISRNSADRSLSELSILCREADGTWRVVFAQVGSGGSYVTASNDLQVRADAALDALQAAPMDDKSEAAALASSWRR